MATQEVVLREQSERGIVRTEDFMPLFGMEQALQRKNVMNEFIGKILLEGVDFGLMPGTNKGKVLMKPGAEKLCTFFGLTPMFHAEQTIEDWSGKEHEGEPLFYYRYKCQLWRGERLLAEAVGSCNSREKKYRMRNGQRLCPKCSTPNLITSKYGKGEFADGWLCYGKRGGCGAEFVKNDPGIVNQEVGQVKNPDVYDVVNTCQKMAQKRALVAAVLIGTNASDSFTQDLEEEIDTGGHAVGTQAAADHVRDEKLKRTQAPSGLTPADGNSASAGGPPTPSAAEDVPEELRAIFADLKPSTYAKAGDMLFNILSQAMPTTADTEWNRLEKKHGLTKAGAKKLEDVKAFLLEVWTLSEYAKSLSGKTEAA